jgi:hypothetical protein
MARFILTQGACPVCDRDVTRAVHTDAGIQKEVFQCPAHGRLEYGPGLVPLAAMGHARDAELPDFLLSQPMTGLELVH